MDSDDAIDALSGLAQATRLAAVRLLVREEPGGIAAGDLARELGVPANTLSSHLTVLSHAGLVTSERQGRSIRYRADLPRLRALTLFLLSDCCDGRPEMCVEPVLFSAGCCAPQMPGRATPSSGTGAP
jgi:ArsR family transcriptional regulator